MIFISCSLGGGGGGGGGGGYCSVPCPWITLPTESR